MPCGNEVRAGIHQTGTDTTAGITRPTPLPGAGSLQGFAVLGNVEPLHLILLADP